MGYGIYVLLFYIIGIILTFVFSVISFLALLHKNFTLILVMAVLNLLLFVFNYSFIEKNFYGHNIVFDIILAFFNFMPLILALICLFCAFVPYKVSPFILLGIIIVSILSGALFNDGSTFRKELKNRSKNKLTELTSTQEKIYENIKQGNFKKLDKQIKEQKNKQIALYFAIHENKKDICEYLISKGADVNVPVFSLSEYYSGPKENVLLNMMWLPPLHYAIYIGNKEIATLLIDKGADVNAKNEINLTILGYAKTEEMKQLLISHGAKRGKDLK